MLGACRKGERKNEGEGTRSGRQPGCEVDLRIYCDPLALAYPLAFEYEDAVVFLCCADGCFYRGDFDAGHHELFLFNYV